MDLRVEHEDFHEPYNVCGEGEPGGKCSVPDSATGWWVMGGFDFSLCVCIFPSFKMTHIPFSNLHKLCVWGCVCACVFSYYTCGELVAFVPS